VIAPGLAMPWSRPSSLYSSPARLWFKLRLGEAPAQVPTALDVRLGAQRPVQRLGVAELDRVLAGASEQCRVTRVHAAAADVGAPGRGHEGFDDLEHAIGLSRTFRVLVDDQCRVADVIDALRDLYVVEWATASYLCAVPFGSPGRPASDTEVAPSTTELDLAWAMREQIGAVDGTGYEPGDPTVVVGILDTGIVAGHPELGANIRAGIDTVQLGAGDFATGMQLLGDTSGVDTDPEDEVGHGTACAGIIGGQGVAIPPGLAAGCSLLPARVLGSASLTGRRERFGVGSIPDIDAGLKRLVDLGAKVLNLSFGTPEEALGPNDPRPHEDVVRYALARGCVLVAASGNSGRQERFTPASLPGVIAVGATDGDAPAAFSTRGEHVALSAPGVRVLAPGLGGYARVTGTSFAAPFVTAAAAQLVSRANRRAYPLGSDELASVLAATCRRWPADVPSGNGSGVLDVRAALAEVDRRIDADDRQEEPP
jgi:subtilisin family serine protease